MMRFGSGHNTKNVLLIEIYYSPEEVGQGGVRGGVVARRKPYNDLGGRSDCPCRRNIIVDIIPC